MKNKLEYLLFHKFQTKINRCGFHYSFKKFIIHQIIFLTIIFLMMKLFRIDLKYIIVIMIYGITCLHFMILGQFVMMANIKKFEQAIIYMEQMIFSFKSNPKILDSLHTVNQIVDGKLKEKINLTIKAIKSDRSYQESLQIIEKYFPNTRIIAMHRFMQSIERLGGQYQKSLDMMLEDIEAWVKRTYSYQKDIKLIKQRIILGIILSLLISASMLFMIPKELVYLPDKQLYQMSTMILFLVLITILTLVQIKLNGEWLIKDEQHYNINHLEAIKPFDLKTQLIKLGLSIPLIILYLLTKQPNIYIVIVIIGLIQILPYLKQKTKRRTYIKAIEQVFPLWLRDLSLDIQSLIVPRAIENSLEYAPNILKTPIENLLYHIHKEPNSITPYHQFLKETKLGDIHNAMTSLYSIQFLQEQDRYQQMQALISRNQEMLQTSEKIKNEDKLAGINFIQIIPMFCAIIKLVIDLFLILQQFMSIGG